MSSFPFAPLTICHVFLPLVLPIVFCCCLSISLSFIIRNCVINLCFLLSLLFGSFNIYFESKFKSSALSWSVLSTSSLLPYLLGNVFLSSLHFYQECHQQPPWLFHFLTWLTITTVFARVVVSLSSPIMFISVGHKSEIISVPQDLGYATAYFVFPIPPWGIISGEELSPSTPLLWAGLQSW